MHYVELDFMACLLDKQLGSGLVADAILKFYELIGKRPFWIDDSSYDPKRIGHMVNVIDISGNKIKIFDNLGGGRIRDENLSDFVGKYFERSGYEFIMGGFGETFNNFISEASWSIQRVEKLKYFIIKHIEHILNLIT